MPIGDYYGQTQPDLAKMLSERSYSHFNARKAEVGNKINSAIANDAGIGALLHTAQAGAAGLPVGFANLIQILQGQGKTDPMALNQNLADISRTGQGAQQDLRGQLAGQGLGRSGVGAALQAAIGQGTADRRAGAQAQETQTAEARKRQDIELMINALVGPALQGYGIEKGVSIGQQQLNQQKSAADQQLLVGLLGSLFGAFA